jgi:flagellin-like hook-associated protein FlgL
MTFPGYTFAVERLQKITNQKLDTANAILSDISTKLQRIHDLLAQMGDDLDGNTDEIESKLQDISTQLDSIASSI